MVGSLPRPRILIMPMISSLYAVPLVILYPVFTVWLGIGSESKIAFASIYGFLPTMLATAAGIQTIDPQLVLAARSMGATLSQRLIRVIIPAAIPTVLSGLRVGGALVIVGVVVSEMLISSAGIGYLISRYRTILDSPHVFAGRAPGAGDGDRLQRRDQMDRRQGRDLADRHPRRRACGRRHARRRHPAGDPERRSPRVFDLTLSFDNGPEPEVTPHVLDVLRRRGIKATFFVIGEKTGRSRTPPAGGARP